MYNGIINIYKEQGFTSHDVVAKLRGILKQKKIGHTGTLDPDATGVLPVCLGSATKLCDMLTDKVKAYEAEFVLGKSTDTQDISGTILNEVDIQKYKEWLGDEKITEAILSFVGKYDQLPPMYSAIKVNGKKLYELAREGKEVERKTRQVEILSIDILKIDFPYVSMRVECSKGTYIRTLCHDIGEKLQVYGTMTKLERIKSGSFEIKDAIKLSKVEELVKGENDENKSGESLKDYVVPADSMFENLSAYAVPENQAKYLLNGNSLLIDKIMLREDKHTELVRVYDWDGKFVGVYKKNEKDKLLKPEKLFWE